MGSSRLAVGPPPDGRPWIRQALAWGAHLYTGLGLVCAAGMAVGIVDGSARGLRAVFWWMIAATVIDATDGTLARAVHVKKVLPGFDGRRLDDIIDFLTYTFLPLLLLWRAEILPPGMSAWLLVPLLASAYGFCQVEAKTADGYFLGFPSYWNLVALYLYLLHVYVHPLPALLSLVVLLGLAALTFVPTRYLYPSQKGGLNLATCGLGLVWAGVLVVILLRLPADGEPVDGLTQGLILGSLTYPAYYLIASWVIELGTRKASLRQGR